MKKKKILVIFVLVVGIILAGWWIWNQPPYVKTAIALLLPVFGGWIIPAFLFFIGRKIKLKLLIYLSIILFLVYCGGFVYIFLKALDSMTW